MGECMRLLATFQRTVLKVTQEQESTEVIQASLRKLYQLIRLGGEKTVSQEKLRVKRAETWSSPPMQLVHCLDNHSPSIYMPEREGKA